MSSHFLTELISVKRPAYFTENNIRKWTRVTTVRLHACSTFVWLKQIISPGYHTYIIKINRTEREESRYSFWPCLLLLCNGGRKSEQTRNNLRTWVMTNGKSLNPLLRLRHVSSKSLNEIFLSAEKLLAGGQEFVLYFFFWLTKIKAQNWFKNLGYRMLKIFYRKRKTMRSFKGGLTRKGKGKGLPRTGHEGPEGEQMYSSTLSLISALDGGGWSTPRPIFIPGKDTVPIV